MSSKKKDVVNFDWVRKNNVDIADLVKMARKNKPGYVEDDDSDGSYYEEVIEEEVLVDEDANELIEEVVEE